MTGVFVTGTDTGIGKTLVSAGLLAAAAQRGLKCVGMKPVAAGLEERDGRWVNADVVMLQAASNIKARDTLVNPCALREPMAPHLAARHEGRIIDIANIRNAFEALRSQAQFIVVEGVGGFRVPLTDAMDTADLAAEFALPIVLAVGMRLGCLNHALLTAEAIRTRGLSLAGWVANCVDPAMLSRDENIATLASLLGAPHLGTIPHLPADADRTAVNAAGHLHIESLLTGVSS